MPRYQRRRWFLGSSTNLSTRFAFFSRQSPPEPTERFWLNPSHGGPPTMQRLFESKPASAMICLRYVGSSPLMSSVKTEGVSESFPVIQGECLSRLRLDVTAEQRSESVCQREPEGQTAAAAEEIEQAVWLPGVGHAALLISSTRGCVTDSNVPQGPRQGREGQSRGRQTSPHRGTARRRLRVRGGHDSRHGAPHPCCPRGAPPLRVAPEAGGAR